MSAERHFVFAEDAHTRNPVTACGLQAVVSEADWWDMTGRTAEWVTDFARPLDEGELTCEECSAAYNAARPAGGGKTEQA